MQKKKNSKKSKTISKLKKELDSIFSKYIRLREATDGHCKCFTCGIVKHYKQMQNGHFMSRSNLSTRWDEENCQVQCVGCNMFKQGEQFKFGKNLDKKYYIGKANELEAKSKQLQKFDRLELEEKIEYYKKKLELFDN